jgi:hypothetical protein
VRYAPPLDPWPQGLDDVHEVGKLGQ